MTIVVEYRVDRLESALAELAREVAQTSREMHEFKNEMRASITAATRSST